MYPQKTQTRCFGYSPPKYSITCGLHMYQIKNPSITIENAANGFAVAREKSPMIKPIIAKTITRILAQDFPLKSAPAITNSITASAPKIPKKTPPTATMFICEPIKPSIAAPISAAITAPIPPIICKIPRMVTPSGLSINLPREI